MTRNHRIISLVAAALAASACSNDGGAREQISAVSETSPPSEPAPAPVSAVSAVSAAEPSALSVKVYKDPNCGCCVEWVKHLRENGFTVETTDMLDLSQLKQKHGITSELRSCHTAVIGDYAIEGHVPADVILKMLKEKPAIAGLAVPGMPMGSPGMEGATRERYDVLTFDRAGRTTVYAQR